MQDVFSPNAAQRAILMGKQGMIEVGLWVCNMRVKTNRQMANEANALIGIASERAKERQRGGQGGILLREPVPQANDNSKAADEVGALPGISGRTVSDMLTVKVASRTRAMLPWESKQPTRRSRRAVVTVGQQVNNGFTITDYPWSN